MTCSSFTIPASPASSTSRTIDVKEKNRIRRSYSDNHICYSFNPIQAKSTQPNNGRSIGFSSFQTSNPMIRVEKNMNVGEITSDQRREIKRANWVERLMQIRSNWKNIGQQRKVADEDNVCYDCENDDYESGEEECDCTKGCSLEHDGEMRYKSYDGESFSRFLVRAPWSDTKLFSKLAFLCNITSVLPDIKAVDLKKYYGLEIVTSSLERQTEAAVSLASSTMIAAREREKQEAEKDLPSLQHSSSPCEWFVCDESSTSTRCFVIQGLNSHASWQAFLLFEPTKFEGTNALVHRGIYEAAKRMFKQFMPEILDHLTRNGERAKLQFTGHCSGGSIALLIHLMLLTRDLVKPSTLLPAVTFGSPFVLCRGLKLLDQLGLDESDHIHCVIMHRDIIPRAFSCNFTNQVTTVMKYIHGSFRLHPCLIKHKMLYSPMGKLFILQPDEKSSLPHPLLPPGSALYALDNKQCGFSSSVVRAFLNSPHPLETLSDPVAYGSEGTISQDHDSSTYLKALNGVLRQYTRMVVRKVRKQRNLLWPLLTSPSPHSLNHEDESDL